MGYSRKSILTDRDIEGTLISRIGILKKNKNYVRFYCASCQTEKNIDFKLAKQIKKAHICPNCFSEIKLHREDYVQEREGLVRKGDKGYYYMVKKKISKRPKVYIKQVAYWEGKKFYARNIARNMYAWTFYTDWEVEHWFHGEKYKDYRLRKSSPYSYYRLEDFFKDYQYFYPGKEVKKRKQDWLEDMQLPEFKSNQKKIVIDNLLNRNQMAAIAIFDLKSIDEVYKYNRYIGNNFILYHYNDRVRLNIYYLDYLYRNKIRFTDFVDFLEQCKELKLKPYKPKDFQKEHEVLTAEVKVKNESKNNEKIKRVYKKLNKLSYDNGKVQIKPFESVREIVEIGCLLHNCLKTYISDYANRRTDIFYIQEKDKVIGAIEVYKGELEQARASHNADLQPRYKRIVNTWYKEAYGQGS